MKKEELFKFRISKDLKDLLESKSQNANISASEFLRQFISSSNINIKTNNKKELKELCEEQMQKIYDLQDRYSLCSPPFPS